MNEKVTPPPFSLRMPADMKSWLEARCALTDRSMNAEIVALLGMLFENDPMTELRIIKEKGRFIVASSFSGERFAAYGSEAMARCWAGAALECVGQPDTNITMKIGEAA